MSGLEFAGVVLGAFPLLISALEHWGDSYKTVDLFIHFESEYRKHMNDVKDEELKFKLHLELLLRPLFLDQVIDETMLNKLLEEPGCTDWSHINLRQALESRLGKAFPRYMEILRELQQSLCKTIKGLGPSVESKIMSKQDPGLVRATAEYIRTAADQRFRQLKFTFNRPGRTERLSELRGTNSKLKDLLEANDQISKVEKRSTAVVSAKASRSLVQYWKHAGRVYTLVQACWGCPCRKTHCAHLWLQHPHAGAFEMKVLILWARDQLVAAQLPPWKQQGLSITWMQGSLLQQAPVGQQVIASVPLSSDTTDKIEPAKKRKKVSFFGGNDKLSRDTMPVPRHPKRAAAGDDSTAATPTQISVKEIQGLCKLLESCGMDQSILGTLTDQGQGQKYRVSSEPQQKLVAKEISLEDVLRLNSPLGLKPGLPRIQVALDVASAHLQLHSTPWARRQWEARDILFPQYTSGENKILFDKPYVSADFSEVLPHGEKSPKSTDRSFGCLGVILLELWYGFALEDHELWQKSGFQQHISDPVIRTMVASKWADEVREQAGAEYAAAVSWCLRESPTTLHGTEWRQDLAENVVMRLERCRDWLKDGGS